MPSSFLSDQIRKHWLQALGSLEPEKLNRRLLWDNLNPIKLNAILGNEEDRYFGLSLDQSSCSISPPWLIALGKICKAIQASGVRPLHELGDDTAHFKSSQLPFRDLWQPAVEWAVLNLRHRLGVLVDTQICDRVFTDLGYRLLVRFCFVSEHALWELFNAKRGAGALFLAYLKSKGDGSDSPRRDHYQEFILQHRCDGLASLLREFPVLGRILGNVLVFWLDSSEELLLRVHQDRESLQEIFDIPTNASFDSIHQGLSDHHCGGRTVAILTFVDNSDSWKVVYKPRDMGIDAAYQQTLADINDNSELPPLRTLKILKRQSYGYMEFVQHRLCKDQQELKRFYYNAGRLSAILYILGCTDCHNENLIANGDQLVLIDTETLFEPTVANHISNESNSNPSKGISDLHKKFNDSILRSNLLPSWLVVGDQNYAVDLSALGINPPTDENELVSGWVGVNTDGMLRGHVKAPVTLPTSLPVGIGYDNPLQQHTNQFLAGFREQSSILIQRRSDSLSPGGVFDLFVGLPRRIVLRATHVYFSIQIQQLQAEALRSEFRQGMKLEQLARFFLMAETQPKNWPIFAAEMRQMEQFDIPYFVHQIDSSQLLLNDGIGAINDFFENTGLQASRQRLESFDEDVLEFQVHLIKGTIQAKELRRHCNLHNIPKQSRANSLDLSAPKRLQIAQSIARELVDISFDNGTKWIGFDLARDCDKLLFRPLGMSLYSGSMGIAVFFACLIKSQSHLSNLSRMDGIERMLQEILYPLTDLADQGGDGALMRWWRDQPPGLGGSAGQLLALIAMDELEVVPNGFKSGRELACQLLEGLRESHIVNNSAFDLIGGVTGLIGPLLLLDTVKSVQLAKLIGDRLAETQDESGRWGNPDSKFTSAPFGFSYGVAGIVAALAQLYRRTGCLYYRDTALKALADDRKKFTAEMDSLLALHPQGTRDSNKLIDSWCHGASGSALGRLCLMGTDLWDTTVEQEVRMMIEIMGQNTFPVDHICCGSFGRIAILRIAHQRLNNEIWREISNQIEASSLHEVLNRDGQFKLFDLQESSLIQPGFMNGISGIGLVLLDNEYSQPMIRTLLSAGLLVGTPSDNTVGT